MAGQIGFVLDGVLRRLSDVNALNNNGLILFEGLKPWGRVTFLVDGYPRDLDLAEHFLKLNRITGHIGIDISVLSDGVDTVDRRLAQINRLRRNGPISFVVEPDPKNAAALLAAGVPTLLYLHPQYTVPSWRPDYNGSLRRWDDLVTETERQVALRADEDLTDKETL
jgi:hypothetical protein